VSCVTAWQQRNSRLKESSASAARQAVVLRRGDERPTGIPTDARLSAGQRSWARCVQPQSRPSTTRTATVAGGLVAVRARQVWWPLAGAIWPIDQRKRPGRTQGGATLRQPRGQPQLLPALERRVGWQPSRFLADRAEAERAFALAERLGSVSAAARELGPPGRRCAGVHSPQPGHASTVRQIPPPWARGENEASAARAARWPVAGSDGQALDVLQARCWEVLGWPLEQRPGGCGEDNGADIGEALA
jgi:hypothetical protein